MKTNWVLLVALLQGKRTKLMFLGIVISLAFSMAVVLSTIGLMDGFDHNFKKSLKKSEGDVIIYNRFGYFKIDEKFENVLSKFTDDNFGAFIQTEAFLVVNEISKGVLLRGVESVSYQNVTGLSLPKLDEGAVFGEVLAKELGLKVGDSFVLALSLSTKEKSHPKLIRLKLVGLAQHGVYEKDARIVYVTRDFLQKELELEERVNIITLKAPDRNIQGNNYSESIRQYIRSAPTFNGVGFVMRPFWSEYTHVLEAVEVEKRTIVLIMQVIVLVAIFNVLAFTFFLNEKKSKEIFLFQALGTNKKRISAIWMTMIGFLWACSCVLSIGFTAFFNILLQNLDIFKLPGKIYNIENLSLLIDPHEYVLTFVVALLWLGVITGVGLFRMSRKSILYYLRREFT